MPSSRSHRSNGSSPAPPAPALEPFAAVAFASGLHTALRVTGTVADRFGERLLRGVSVSSLDVEIGRRSRFAVTGRAARAKLPRVESLETRR